MSLEESKTYRNVRKAFSHESQAIVRYMFYADIARNEGKIKAAELFDLMARNEFNHAKVWFGLMNDSLSQNTLAHLKEAAFDEHSEWKDIYPDCTKTAREEGFEEIAELFERISSIEADHERRFIELYIEEESNLDDNENINKAIEDVKNKQTEQSEEKKFYCMFCGFPSETELDTCPFCGATSSFMLA